MKTPKQRSFSDRVYAVVKRIPRGTVLTYAEVARRAGRPKAVRAVGYWMSKNYDPKIPCHRVVRSDGTVGNYNRGGPNKKRTLLKQEGALY